jgi:hypothetical protein
MDFPNLQIGGLFSAPLFLNVLQYSGKLRPAAGLRAPLRRGSSGNGGLLRGGKSKNSFVILLLLLVL